MQDAGSPLAGVGEGPVNSGTQAKTERPESCLLCRPALTLWLELQGSAEELGRRWRSGSYCESVQELRSTAGAEARTAAKEEDIQTSI